MNILQIGHIMSEGGLDAPPHGADDVVMSDGEEEVEDVEVDREDVMRGEVVVEEAAEEVDRCSPSSFCCTRFLITKILSLMDAEIKICHFQVKQGCISSC